MSVNKVILLGNVGKQPEIRESNGSKFATFSLATSEKGYTTKDGRQIPDRTEWHNIVANGRVVEVIERYVTQGTKLYIEGKLRTRKYTDRNNTERYTTEVILDVLELIGGKPTEHPQPAPQQAPVNQFSQPQYNVPGFPTEPYMP